MTPADRFSRHIDRTGSCWIWIGTLDALGYGRVRVGGVLRPAHRVSYELFVGQIPEGAYVRRSCGDPLCVRPEHLYLHVPACRQIERIPFSGLDIQW
jgi:hypothetical protein